MIDYLKILLIIIIFLPSTVFASRISVGTVIVDFNKDKKRNYVDVPVFNINKKNEDAYVNVSLYEVKNPGTDKEEKILVTKNNRDGLIVSPQKMIIPARGKKNIRFIYLNKKHKEDKVSGITNFNQLLVKSIWREL